MQPGANERTEVLAFRSMANLVFALQKIREQAAFSLARVADDAQMGGAICLSRYERGRREPRMDALQRWVHALGLEVYLCLGPLSEAPDGTP